MGGRSPDLLFLRDTTGGDKANWSERVLMGLDYRGEAPLLFKRIPVLAVTDDDERDFAESGVITFRDRRGASTPSRDAALLAGD